MAKPKSRPAERKRLKEIRRDLPNVGSWSPQQHGEVNEALRLIMLLGTVVDDADFAIAMEAVGLFVELEGVRQQLEHDDRRAEWAKFATVTVRVYSPATGELISERVLRPPSMNKPAAI